ncbi:MAG: tRNA (guanosine(37)-N1)-methyltransferase TrmD [Oleiphilaceae bacterium]|nr:tRNA (guanosine(37)-N1)-methyltransferase TrmD [Oleiphilaceae bacterium]
MWFGVVSLFPEMFRMASEFGVLGRAIQRDSIQLDCFNPRDFTQDRHRTVDDRPYGGGPGMLMKVAPLKAALEHAKKQAPAGTKVVYLSPQGKLLSQRLINELVQESSLILLAGRYEGVDERLVEEMVDEEVSIGDYVLSGGELPALVLIDAVARWIPGVLGHEASADEDSFASGLLDSPHYTRPEEYEGRRVPEVLLSGDHERIRQWRLKQSLGRTWERRPDLLENCELTAEQQSLLQDYIDEVNR